MLTAPNKYICQESTFSDQLGNQQGTFIRVSRGVHLPNKSKYRTGWEKIAKNLGSRSLLNSGNPIVPSLMNDERSITSSSVRTNLKVEDKLSPREIPKRPFTSISELSDRRRWRWGPLFFHGLVVGPTYQPRAPVRCPRISARA